MSLNIKVKVDFSQEIKSYTGETFITGQRLETCPHCGKDLPQIDDNSGEPLTLRLICARALSNPSENEMKTLSGEQKAVRGLLAIMIFQSDATVELKVGDIKILKEAIGNSTYNPVVIARAYEMLDPSE